MAANTLPIFSKAPAINAGAATHQVLVAAAMTASTSFTGTDANAVLAFTADATNGSFVQKIRFKWYNTNGSGNSTATVARIWINNGSAVGTATNNTLVGEVTLPVQTYSQSAATNDIDYPMNIALPAGYKIYVGVGTTVGTNQYWAVTVMAGNY